ncbi:Class V chitinase [Linum grandiflorum]
MELLNLLLVLISLPFFFQHSSASAVKSGYWFAGGDLPVSEIDSALFTHLFCAFADLDPRTSHAHLDPSNLETFSTFSATVRRRNPSVKTILSIGADKSTTSSADFAAMAAQPSSRKKFIASAISLANSLGFDGLDLSWNHPSNSTQMADFAQLVTELNLAAAAEKKSSFILSARVFHSPEHGSVRYPVHEMAQSLDWINVMAYDFYSPVSSQITGPPAGLYNPGNRISVNSGIGSWVESGFPVGKIVVGFPLYGYAWKLSDPEKNGYFAPADGGAGASVASGDGSMSFEEIRKFIVPNRASSVFNSSIGGDYSYTDDGIWIGYDNYLTIVKKVVYAEEKGLLGYFLWHLGMDENWGLSRTAMEAWGGNLEKETEEMKSMKASVRFSLSVSWAPGSLIFPLNHLSIDQDE